MPLTPPPWAGATLSPPLAAAGIAVVAYCVVAEPLVGRFLHRRMEAAVGRDPAARTRHYGRLLALEVALGVAALLLAALLPGISLHRLGLGRPQTANPLELGIGLGACVALGIGLALSVVVIWRLRAPLPVVGGDRVRVLVPTTPGERGWFLGLSLAAGICEELLFRGLLLALLSALLGGPPAWLVVLLGAVAFGLAHAYQGPVGILVTTLMGALLGGLYAVTGSLLLVMLVHAAFDGRMGLLPSDALARRA
ncbi:MAG: CPBP family intramembrane glutamic endopeptidase [Candidatus Dormiibacterota bacterium]